MEKIRKIMLLLIVLALSVTLPFCAENDKGKIETVSIPVDSIANTNPYDSTFLPGVPLGLIENDDLTEVSGIAFGRVNPEFIWAHNDSGDEAKLFLVGSKGEHLGVVVLNGIENRDWEDMCIQTEPVSGKHMVYIGDTGNNGLAFDQGMIYAFEEPDLQSASIPIEKEIDVISTYRFQYPDGPKDAETLLVDPVNGDIIIISKEVTSAAIYILNDPVDGAEHQLEKIGTLPIGGIVGGDISSDGKEILLKTYANVFYWERQGDESIIASLERDPKLLHYFREAQGEAIAFSTDLSAYYTISEEPASIQANLIIYSRRE